MKKTKSGCLPQLHSTPGSFGSGPVRVGDPFAGEYQDDAPASKLKPVPNPHKLLLPTPQGEGERSYRSQGSSPRKGGQLEHTPMGFRQQMQAQGKIRRVPSSENMKSKSKAPKSGANKGGPILKIKRGPRHESVSRTARRLNQAESQSIMNQLDRMSGAQLKEEMEMRLKRRNEVKAVRNPHKPLASVAIEKKSHFDGTPLSLDEFTQLRVIGRGTYGLVKLVRHKASRQLYALKILDKRQQIDEDEVQHVLNESRTLKDMQHPFIVRQLGTFQDPEKLFLLMEYVTGSDLFAYMSDLEFDEELTRFFAAQVVLILEYMHGHGLVFRDLKPENLLVDWKGYLKLTDFSFSKRLAQDERTYTFCGTPCYLAPEIILQEGHGMEVDWWALGVLTYEMISGHPPFDNEDVVQLYNDVLISQPTFPPGQFSVDAENFCRQLLDKEPSQRLGAAGVQEVKDHPFFESIDWDALRRRKIKSLLPTQMIETLGTKVNDFENNFGNGAPLSAEEQALFADW